MKRIIFATIVIVIMSVSIGIASVYYTKESEQSNNIESYIIETKDVTITHLDIAILSPTERYFYASVLNKREGISLVVEINEAQYVRSNVGDTVVLQKETIKTDDGNDTTKYAIVNAQNKLRDID